MIPPLFATEHGAIATHTVNQSQFIKLWGKAMTSEIVTAAALSFSLILVGLSVGFLMLKLQGGEAE